MRQRTFPSVIAKSSALALSFVLLATAIAYTTGQSSDESLKTSLSGILSREIKGSVSVAKKTPLTGGPLPLSRSYDVRYPNGAAATAFLVPITGHAGPFTAVFLVRNGTSVSFAGLIGVARPDNPEYYGITDRILSSWKRRIEIATSHSAEVKHEKK